MKIFVDNTNFLNAAQKAIAAFNNLLVVRDLTFRINYVQLLDDILRELHRPPHESVELHFFGTSQVPFEALLKDSGLYSQVVIRKHTGLTNESAGQELEFCVLEEVKRATPAELFVLVVGDRNISKTCSILLDQGKLACFSFAWLDPNSKKPGHSYLGLRVHIVTFLITSCPLSVRAGLSVQCLDQPFAVLPTLRTTFSVHTAHNMFGFHAKSWKREIPPQNRLLIRPRERGASFKSFCIDSVINAATGVLAVPFRVRAESSTLIFLVAALTRADDRYVNFTLLVDKHKEALRCALSTALATLVSVEI